MKNLIKITEKDGQLVVSSRQVAENFGKEHKNVLQTIQNLVAENSAAKLFFIETTFENRGKQYPEYLMTRDGFSLLVMGFTGNKALEWKLKYIEAFNHMEAELNSPERIMARALKIAEEKLTLLTSENAMQKQIIGELQPKANYVDRILQNRGLVTITQIAKDYGMSGYKLNKILHELGVQYKQGTQWLLYSKYHDKGYTHSYTVDIIRTDGREDVVMETKWTQKGRLFLYELLKSKDIYPTIEKAA